MPVKAKYIKDLPLKRVLDGSESLLVQDLNGTQQAPLGTIVDEIKQNSQEKIREIESELNQTNAQLSKKADKSSIDLISNKFEQAVANVTNGNESATNSEVVSARNGEISLATRLDKSDNILNKVKQGILLKDIISTVARYKGYIKSSDFSVTENDPNYVYTDYIEIAGGTTINYQLRGQKEVYLISFYDNKRVPISGVSTNLP